MTTARRKLTPIPFTQVTFDDPFWAPRIETNCTTTIPHMYEMNVQAGRISAFDLNFTRPVPTPLVDVFGDHSPAAWIESASLALATHSDPNLEVLVEQLIDKIIRAQLPDGYLNTQFIVTQPDMRWKNLRDFHELFCAGHMIEAAVAHFRATGSRKFLDALCRYADLINATFGPEQGKKHGYDGHPEIELALIKLYHATGCERYRDLARFFVEERGQHSPDHPLYYEIEARERGEVPGSFWAKTYEYCQAHAPIREQEKVVGHAVRAMYLFSAAADLAHEYNDPTLLETCERLWDNLIHKRMYLTGGIGPSRNNEGFTEDYDLPDETAYAETCAAIGVIFWNHRLLQFQGARKYADVLERALYNGFISGVSLDGKRFYYENPLASSGDHHRQEWFACPCCPPNLSRTLASVGDYFYSSGPTDVWVHLYAQGSTNIQISGEKVLLRQETRYPWYGDITITMDMSAPQTFTLHLRIPGWCERFQVSVNQQVLDALPQLDGYLAIVRAWQPGDIVRLTLDMPVQVVWANPAVRQLEGRVALQRGPLVYCLEGVDNGFVELDRISIDPDDMRAGKFTMEFCPDLLGGVTVLRGPGRLIDNQDWDEKLYSFQRPKLKEVPVTAVPYCTWDNREPGEMRVWLRAEG
ncbi:MAG: glycoside hydrolase family 127 protein [Planctomycetes bacterium]|nr:glycoside hydrolase family 127 protein [Planctomycetota bacterium]